MEIKKSAFAGCCVIDILYDFGYTTCTTGNDRAEHSTSILEREIKKIISKPMSQSGLRPPVKAMHLISLNAVQKKKMHKTLKKLNFKLASKGWNGTHSNMNYLYSLECKKP